MNLSDPQEQFLNVIDRDEAERRFHAALVPRPLGEEDVSLDEALGRVLARDVTAAVDVPSFDHSNYDGFAVRACDTFGAVEERPRRLKLNDETLAPGAIPRTEVQAGWATSIATGGMAPRGADAVVMVEHAEYDEGELLVRKAVVPGFGVSHAGTDIAAGETVFHRGRRLTSRETGVLAAIGVDRVAVWRRPRVAILSTGDEIIAPGAAMRPGLVYDSNSRILADSVRELGGKPLLLGVVPDEIEPLRRRLHEALAVADVVLLSGGTSKGQGDLCYRVVGELKNPGVVAHGVALKPGKPICLAVEANKPVVILPGFPTSAIFTFHEFVAPIIRRLAGERAAAPATVKARMAVQVNSEIGRTEYLLVGLVESVSGATEADSKHGRLAAYPMGKGSGSVTTFSRADGFVIIGRHEEIVDAGAEVDVQLLGAGLQLADLVVIGSHCLGLDELLGEVEQRGFRTKFLAVGSTAGLAAVERGECDVAGVHLLDAESGEYNRPFLKPGMVLVQGYGRMQGVVFRPGDDRFEGRAAEAAVEAVKQRADCVMVNRNAGSGTHILIDRLLAGSRPPGYTVAPRNHNAVAAAVSQGRADWGLAIESAARRAGLGFLPLAWEQYDFVMPVDRAERPAVRVLREMFADSAVRLRLREMGFRLEAESPQGETRG